MKKRFRKYISPLILVILLSVLGGVVYFDTYPTHWSKNVTLSEIECQQFATLVAAQAFKKQNPGVPQPAEAQKMLDESSRLAKRVAKYVLDSYPEIINESPMFVWLSLSQSCIMNQGQIELK